MKPTSTFGLDPLPGKAVRPASAWVQTSELHAKSTDEWVARCRARVLHMDAQFKTDEADALVWHLSQLESWRGMAPEAAADRVCQFFATARAEPDGV